MGGPSSRGPFPSTTQRPISSAQSTHGARLSFWGGVSAQGLLPYGTPDQARADVRRLLAEVGRDGGYVLAPTHAIPGNAKPENVMAMIETVNDQ